MLKQQTQITLQQQNKLRSELNRQKMLNNKHDFIIRDVKTKINKSIMATQLLKNKFQSNEQQEMMQTIQNDPVLKVLSSIDVESNTHRDTNADQIAELRQQIEERGETGKTRKQIKAYQNVLDMMMKRQTV